MAYVALYRKWRPERFSDLVGQEHISRTIAAAITSGRVGHAYLFSGPRGTGKTSTAKIFARALNCEQGPTPEPCGECAACRKIADGSSLDVFEIDAASNRGIDEIRDLRETVKFAPVDGRYKVYIIDEVHMLTTEAFNALLKTLEEPPGHVVFILATTEAHKVPATIQSRCQRYDFHRISTQEIEARLMQVTQAMELVAEPEALALIALQADGGLRDALSLLDQCASLADGKLTAERVRQIMGLVGHECIYKLTAALASHETQTALTILAELLRDGKELKQVLAELALHLRSLMIFQAAGSLGELNLYEEQEAVLREQAVLFRQEQLMWMLARLHEAMAEMRWSPQPRITIEVALLEMCRGWDAPSRLVPGQAGLQAPQANTASEARLARLEAKLAQLSAKVAQGTMAAPAAAKPQQVAPWKAASNPVTAAAAPVEQALVVDGQGQQLWQRLLQTLQQRNKPQILACLQGGGRFAGLGSNHFHIRFNSSLMASLTMRNYRGALEEILAELAGRPLQLVARGEDMPAAPSPRPRASARLEPVSEPELQHIEVPPEERPSILDAAVKVFGDNIVAVEEEN